MMASSMLRVAVCLAVVMSAMSPAKSEAALVTVDLWRVGDSRVTRDQGTSLDWLDLVTTVDVSLDDVAAGYGNLAAAGFRVATATEVRQLFVNAGTVTFNDPSLLNAPAALLLQQLLGCTFCRLDPGTPGLHPQAVVRITSGIMQTDTGYGFGSAMLLNNGFGSLAIQSTQFTSTSHHQFGSGLFLVRAMPGTDELLPGNDPTPRPVPEPLMVYLVAAGAIAATRQLRRATV